MLEHDYSLPISFSMAAQIGLEETVLLTYLQQQCYAQNTQVLRLDVRVLSGQLSFWTVPILMRVLGSLQLGQLLNFQRQNDIIEVQLTGNKVTAYATNHDATSHHSVSPNSPQASYMSHDTQADSVHEAARAKDDALMEKMDRLHKASRQKNAEFTPQAKTYSTQTPIRQYDTKPIPNKDRRGVTDFDLYLEQKERARQPDQWQPEEATFEQIQQAGIAREFAVELQTEFLLRIKEQRKNVRTWNSEFFKYVKRQWQYKQSDRSSYEGTSDSSTFTKTSREQVSDALSNIHDTDW
ncbi:DnaT-like ssDNA-binding domain-containing protein [Marinomonas sp. THO17]|uniref:DnaT-like ssDNA-binding domain-containing protein n=1 Tax=Marinomonas sp. THO17 TaxID=3149048 RepID=UPI00336BCD33